MELTAKEIRSLMKRGKNSWPKNFGKILWVLGIVHRGWYDWDRVKSLFPDKEGIKYRFNLDTKSLLQKGTAAITEVSEVPVESYFGEEESEERVLYKMDDEDVRYMFDRTPREELDQLIRREITN